MVTAEEFVRVWQTSSCSAKVVEKLGIAHPSSRASYYRRVPLKHMPRRTGGRNPLDIPALTKPAESLKGER